MVVIKVFVNWVTSAHLLGAGPMLNIVHLASQGVVLTNSIGIPSTVRNARCVGRPQICSIRASRMRAGAWEPDAAFSLSSAIGHA